MRALPIMVTERIKGPSRAAAAFRKNWVRYLQEATGLAIFMASACFFSTLLESEHGAWHINLVAWQRNLIMGVMMGATALFIFYSPVTAGSGAQINPAVTFGFWRLKKMCPWDSLFYMIFQCAGGIGAVLLMQAWLGRDLTDPPVRWVVTVPAGGATWKAAAMEAAIGFITMFLVLLTSSDKKWKRMTRPMAAVLVMLWVIIAGPVSGFGMNPARSLASALPAHIWTDAWIYLLVPMLSMWLAAEYFLVLSKQRAKRSLPISEN